MAVATFRHGECRMVDHTPSVAVTAGDVVAIGAIPYVAHLDIEANRLGALAAAGGVYDVTAGETIRGGEAVYYDISDETFYNDATGDRVHFGYTVPDSEGDAADTIRVHHSPNGVAYTAS